MKRLCLFLILFCGLAFSQDSKNGTVTTSGSDCTTAAACVSLPLASTSGAVGLSLSGTFTGTAQFEVSADNGATWVAASGTPPGSTTTATSATAAGTWRFAVSGLTTFRVRASALSAGSITVTIQSSQTSASLGGSGGGFTPPVVTSGLIGRYAMSDATGTSLPDTSGSGNNGTLVNSPTVGTQGIAFASGSTQYATLPAGINAGRTVQIFTTASYANFNSGYRSYFGSDTAANVTLLSGYDSQSSYLEPTTYQGGSFLTVPNEGMPSIGMVSAVFDSVADKIYINDHESVSYRYTGGTTGFSGTIRLASSNVSGGFDGTMYYVLVYNRKLTAAEVSQNYYAVLGILQGRGLTVPAVNNSTGNNLVFAGDSITAAIGGATPFPTTVSPFDTFTKYNLGVNGMTMASGRDSGQAIDNLYAPLAAQNVLVVFWGTNDAGTITAQATHDLLVAFCRERRKKGWKVIVITMLSRTGQDTFKNSYNALIRASWRSYADALADAGADPNMGCDGCSAIGTYFQDGIHPTTTGNNIIAQIVTAQVNSVKASVPQVALSSATAVSVNANSTSAQNLMSLTPQTGAFNAVDKMVHVLGSGIYTTLTSTPTITLAVKVGSVVVCSWTTAATTAAVTNSWYYDAYIGTISTGSSGTVICKGTAHVQIGATGGVRAPEIDVETNNAASSAIDLTASQAIQTTITFSANQAGAHTGKQWLGSVQSVN